MKQNLVIFVLGAIALLSLPGCTGNTSTSSDVTTTTTPSDTQASIKAGGSSSALDFLRALEVAYESTSKNKQITLLEPGQSENIIAGIKQGLVDVGAISKTLKPEENDGTLEFREVAKDALVVATNSSVTGVKNLTTENLKAIYSGSVTNWQQLGGQNAQIVVLDRPEDESAKRLLRKYYLGKDLKNAANAVVLRKEGELIQTIQSTPHSIGAFSLAHAVSHKLPVNRLSLNNIEPTLENLKTGKYQMTRTITVVWSKKASEATKSFINYILSPSGTEILEQSSFVSITPAAVSQVK
ncbi:substrate-binding domain-containing protein [Calothrix sp. PCC 6303]|uniref:substrate-binding domain-containing protein n=1 Tax=Calothrix sp. PCC 6303 TaxID=1170562 RepID=UPI0002A00C64|nr:substrate-binding domain-containing protein [Calothrix sp. PCC 6303]AFZ02108.1 phosphate ABC transporter substrate-binding protein, PhoT family [Calothrix sp. PCC 6303]